MNLKWFAQENENTCVAACVRMVLEGLGHPFTEKEILKVLGRPRLGITLKQAQLLLSNAGITAEIDADLNLEDIRDYTRKNIFPIVGVERHVLGYLPASHAVVTSKVTSQSVEIFDPYESEYPKVFSLGTFESAWQLSGKEALIISKGFAE